MAQDTKACPPPLLARLRSLIESGRFPAGSRLPATRALATELQVSRATVGALLHHLEAEGLIVAGSERIRFVAGNAAPAGSATAGPAPAASSAAARTDSLQLPAGTIVILSSVPVDYPNVSIFPFAHGLHVALSRGLLAAGLNPFLMVGGLEQAQRAAELRPELCVVLDDAFGEPPDFHGHLAPLRQAGTLVVTQSDRLPNDILASLTTDCLQTDHRAGGAALVQHLASRGRKRLLAVFPEFLTSDVHWTNARECGIRETCSALGLQEPLVVRLPQIASTNNTSENFRRGQRLAAGFLGPHLSGPGAVDAILAPSDGEVPAIASAARNYGRIPGADLDIAGYDGYWRNIPERQYDTYRPEGSIDRDGPAVGTALAELAVTRLANRGAAQRIRLVPSRLLVGDAIG